MAEEKKVEGCKCNWAECHKDCNCRCHIAVEAHSTHSFLVGISAGLEKAAQLLLKRAAESFTAGRDTEAMLMRALSKTLDEDGKKSHPGPRPLKYEE